MANIRSQMKRNRQAPARRARNRSIKTEIHTRTKQALSAAQSGDAAAAREALLSAQKRIDSAVAKGVLHRNTAARRKSRLAKEVAALLG
ncbi:MAG: 30S ribosomal protein S20 [Acidimicrobiia bacterium]|nr:30S ribosomal protein S20 [Acidimicrobiia bacterium]MBT8248652.1 30S ribosomal protein S20 [Acidimicrobiia bacterium]NNC42557.1 30S ribosomal protein S20 [Acidimicrobiia bacterium]NND13435.1 30S ribosomal protein S20 [Acidimicrobiia bacterium]NNL26826.1 30S ribosomal protein S20 [Acidimicrobiia bacterium]